MPDTLQTSIELYDRATKPLRTIASAAETVTKAFRGVDTSAAQAFGDMPSQVNTAERAIKSGADQTRRFESQLKNVNSAGGSLVGTFKRVAGAIGAAFGVSAIIKTSDAVAQTKSRLDLMNDGMQSTQELQNMIYESAKRSRGAYLDTADAVAKMGILAGDAFSSNDEIIAFMEQVNKQFTISGTSAEGTQAATLQLTQAMGAGVLRGEELNSVLEQAPTIVQTIAKHLGISTGQLREMASEGQITSEVVKEALLGAAEETNAKFESMPKTFGQIWTGFKNSAVMAFQTTLQKLNEIANSPAFDTLLSNAEGALMKIEPIATGALQAILDISTNRDVINFFGTLRDSVVKVGKAVADVFGLDSSAGFFGAVTDGITKLAKTLTPAIQAMGDFVSANAKFLPAILGVVVAFKGLSSVASIAGKIKNFTAIFKGTDTGTEKLLNPFTELAKANTKNILKGIANLTVIVVGLGAIAALVMAAAPYISRLGDLGSFVKVSAAIAVIGTVGSAMSMLAGKVGNIPVATVAKGLANMAIVIAGLGALTVVLGAATLLDFDYSRLLGLVGLIGILGTVGAALSLFAGIAGAMPIPVVLAGIANIALVITGMSAVIIAFGGLSQIPGFNEFIQKGGDTLALLFQQIGKIAGSALGGLGEGITNSLPKIGENLSNFAAAIRPMFDIFSGIDAGGVGEFLSGFGAFVAAMAGDKIVSIFAGGTDFAKLGSDLTTFAENSRGFFEAVAGFPEAGFTKASALFQSLGDISNVPNSGGIAQWFSGKNDFEGLADGLGKLAGEGVVKFFNTVADLPEAGFSNAPKFFQALGDISAVPNSGGIGQWFSGTNDFTALANGLGALAGEGVVKFFNMVANLPETSFENMVKLFNALSSIEGLPKEGGISGWFGGDVDLGGLGSQLGTFATNAQSFFTAINSLNVNNITGLILSLRSLGEVISNLPNTLGVQAALSSLTSAVTQMEDVVKSGMDTVAKTASQKMKEFVQAISNGGTQTKTKLSEIKTNIETAFTTINLRDTGKNIIQGLIDGIDSKRSAAIAAARDIADAIRDTIDSAMGIASPSKVMMEKGRYITEGLAIGMENRLRDVKRAALSLSSAAGEYPKTTFGNRDTVTARGDYSDIRSAAGKSDRGETKTIVKAPITITINNDNEISSEMDLTDVIKRMSNGIYANLQSNLEANYGV